MTLTFFKKVVILTNHDDMGEWLSSGLQNRSSEFKSQYHLHLRKPVLVAQRLELLALNQQMGVRISPGTLC